jgi:hypothetical protein
LTAIHHHHIPGARRIDHHGHRGRGRRRRGRRSGQETGNDDRLARTMTPRSAQATSSVRLAGRAAARSSTTAGPVALGAALRPESPATRLLPHRAQSSPASPRLPAARAPEQDGPHGPPADVRALAVRARQTVRDAVLRLLRRGEQIAIRPQRPFEPEAQRSGDLWRSAADDVREPSSSSSSFAG